MIEFESNGEITSIIKFVNPVGHYCGVWKGAWSKNSIEYKLLDPDIKEQNNLNIDDNVEEFL
jgi:hypothetical protein